MGTFGRSVPEFIYGTLLMVALVGAFVELHAGTSEIVATLLGSSIALWLAHCYSRSVGLQLERGRYLHLTEIWSVLREQLLVVAIVPLPLTLIALAEAGFLTTTTALRLSAWGGVAILFVAGATVARQATDSMTRMILGGLLNSSLGAAIILLEAIFAH